MCTTLTTTAKISLLSLKSSPKFPTKNLRKQELNVQFKTELKEVLEVPQYLDISLWLDEDDLYFIKQEMFELVRLAEQNGGIFKEDEDTCFRGLERQTEEGSMANFLNRKAVLDAVLDSNVAHDNENAEELSSLSCEASKEARNVAQKNAFGDEEAAREYLAVQGDWRKLFPALMERPKTSVEKSTSKPAQESSAKSTSPKSKRPSVDWRAHNQQTLREERVEEQPAIDWSNRESSYDWEETKAELPEMDWSNREQPAMDWSNRDSSSVRRQRQVEQPTMDWSNRGSPSVRKEAEEDQLVMSKASYDWSNRDSSYDWNDHSPEPVEEKLAMPDASYDWNTMDSSYDWKDHSRRRSTRKAERKSFTWEAYEAPSFCWMPFDTYKKKSSRSTRRKRPSKKKSPVRSSPTAPVVDWASIRNKSSVQKKLGRSKSCTQKIELKKKENLRRSKTYDPEKAKKKTLMSSQSEKIGKVRA